VPLSSLPLASACLAWNAPLRNGAVKPEEPAPPQSRGCTLGGHASRNGPWPLWRPRQRLTAVLAQAQASPWAPSGMRRQDEEISEGHRKPALRSPRPAAE